MRAMRSVLIAVAAFFALLAFAAGRFAFDPSMPSSESLPNLVLCIVCSVLTIFFIYKVFRSPKNTHTSTQVHASTSRKYYRRPTAQKPLKRSAYCPYAQQHHDPPRIEPPKAGQPPISFQNDKRILLESVDLMGSTKSLGTLLSRFDVARHAILRIYSSTGDSEAKDLMNILLEGLEKNLPRVTELEVLSASSLKTEKGRIARFNKLIEILEMVDREDDDVVDNLISAAQNTIFKKLEEKVDWEKEPDQPLTINLSQEELEKLIDQRAKEYMKEKGWTK